MLNIDFSLKTSKSAMQACLPLGAGEYVAYGRTDRHNVFLAHATPEGWSQRAYSLSEAVYYADCFADQDFLDTYASANGFRNYYRRVSSVSEITGFFIDFDYYKTEYADLSVAEFADTVIDAMPWLPVPTVIVSSGRGAYFFWRFKRPLPINTRTARYNYLPQWQTQQDFLIRHLKPFGADPQCADAARVLRLPGTINSKNNVVAEAWETGRSYEFAELKSIFNAKYKAESPKKALTPPPKGQSKQSRCNVSSIHNWYILAWSRMRDLKTLARLRGGILKDQRRMAIYAYAVEAAHYCRSLEALQAEVQGFIHDCIDEPGKYQGFSLNEVFRRFTVQLDRGGVWLKTEQDSLYLPDNRYRHGRRYVVRTLNITDKEARKLQVLITANEKERRRKDARRKAGIQPRDEYEAKRNQDKAELKAKVLELLDKGHNRGSAAKVLGISLRYVHSLLAGN